MSTHAMASGRHEPVVWSEDGSRLIVLDRERMVSAVVPLYYQKHFRYPAWERSMRRHRFRREEAGDHEVWQHPRFHRDHPEWLGQAELSQAAVVA